MATIYEKYPTIMKEASRPAKRGDIQGLRTVGAFLVAVFHIFQLGVSGGVDVFLVVSGYFLWAGGIRVLEHGGFLNYYRNFFQRTAPQAILVIIVVLLVATAVVSPVEWISVLRDGIFSSIYLQNYWLAMTGQNYLASNEGISIFQHYWAIAVIAQVNLSFPILVFVALVLASMFKANKITTFRFVIATASLLSFLWSLYISQINPTVAYYDTLARIWQFGVGALIASWSGEKKVPDTLGNVLSWCGLIAILSCGLMFRNSFPGAASLWPTLGAVLILKYSHENSDLRNAGAALSNRGMVGLGSMTFGIYLWHFPIFALYFRHTQDQSVFSAALIIFAAIVLAWLSSRFLSWLESIFRTGWSSRYGYTSAVVITIFLTCLGCLGLERILVSRPTVLADYVHPISRMPLTILGVRSDLPEVYELGCHQDMGPDELLTCSFGPDAARAKVFLVGGSHSAQWIPPLQEITANLGLQLISMTKSSCRFFSTEAVGMGTYRSESCRNWNDRVMQRIAAEKPEFLVALVDSSLDDLPSGIPHALNKVADMGVTVIALRDTPDMAIDVPACVSQPLLSNPEECRQPRTEVLDDQDYELALASISEDVQVVDLTGHICPDGICDVIQNGMVMWRDSHHLTATYAKSLADELLAEIGSTLVK